MSKAVKSVKDRLLSLLTDALILFLGVGGLFFTLISVFSLDIHHPTLLVWCAVCALGFLAVFSLSRWRALPLLGAAGLWCLALWRCWDTLALGEISIRCSVVNTYSYHIPTITPIEPIAQLPAETWIAAATLLALLAVVPVAALAAWALVGRRLPGLFFWLTFPFLLPALVITQQPALPPLFALILSWIGALLPSLAAKGNRAARVRLTLVVLPCAAALLALLALLLPVEDYQRPRWAEDARTELNGWALRAFGERFDGDGPGGGQGGSSLADAEGGVDLAGAGPLRYSGNTVLRVTAPDLEGRIYLRGFSGAIYEGDRWAPLSDEVYTAFASGAQDIWDNDYVLDRYGRPVDDGDPSVEEGASMTLPVEADPFQDYQPMNFPALADRASNKNHDYVSFTVENLGADPGYVYYPYQILTGPEELGGAAFVQDAYLARAEDVWEHTLYLMPECDPLSGAVLTGEAAEAEARYSAFVNQCYTQLGQEIPPETVEALFGCLQEMLEHPETSLPGGTENEHYQRLLSVFASSTFISEQGRREMYLAWAGMVADYLGHMAEYDPDTPAAPEGEDFVVHFLTESRRGYCMHFASAATLLLRCMGMPARYVSGYVADLEGGQAQVPDSNAHAWVEIYIEDYGWEPIEVTPAYAGATPGRSIANPEPTPTPTPTPTSIPSQSQSPEAAPTPTPTPGQTGPSAGTEGLELDLRWLWIPGIFCSAALALWLRRSLTRLVRERRFGGSDTNRAVIAAYRYCLRLTRWGGSMDPRLEELAKKAAFSQHTLTENEQATATEVASRTAREIDSNLTRLRRFVFRYILGLD